MTTLRVKRLHPGAKLPTRATPGAACFDICALSDRGGMAGIAQPLPDVELAEVTELSETVRGDRGLGSTGVA